MKAKVAEIKTGDSSVAIPGFLLLDIFLKSYLDSVFPSSVAGTGCTGTASVTGATGWP
jgi:hypothetical protein